MSCLECSNLLYDRIHVLSHFFYSSVEGRTVEFLTVPYFGGLIKKKSKIFQGALYHPYHRKRVGKSDLRFIFLHVKPMRSGVDVKKQSKKKTKKKTGGIRCRQRIIHYVFKGSVLFIHLWHF